MATGTDGSEDAPHPAGPTPNREGKREPAVIDATAEEMRSETAAEEESAEEAPAAAHEPQESRPQPPRTPPGISPQRLLPWFAVALAGLALLIAGGLGVHLFATTDGAIVDLRSATAALQTRTAGLDQKTAATADAVATLAALDRRVAALEAAVKASTASLASLQSETEKAVSLAEAAAPAAAAAPQVDLAPLERRIAAIEAQLQPLAAAVAASKTEVSADQDNVRKAVSSSDAAALVVVAQSLLGALDRGAPFASEVTAAETLGANPDRIAALQPVAGKGVPTAAALAESFAPLAAPILTGAQSKEPQSILDRLERGASSLVRVRPVGAPTGDDPAAIIARIEDALGRGDVAASVSAWDQLPAPAKSVTGDWASSARARVEADSAAHALLADAIDRLGRSKS
jgi:hypothetical protein